MIVWAVTVLVLVSPYLLRCCLMSASDLGRSCHSTLAAARPFCFMVATHYAFAGPLSCNLRQQQTWLTCWVFASLFTGDWKFLFWHCTNFMRVRLKSPSPCSTTKFDSKMGVWDLDSIGNTIPNCDHPHLTATVTWLVETASGTSFESPSWHASNTTRGQTIYNTRLTWAWNTWTT